MEGEGRETEGEGGTRGRQWRIQEIKKGGCGMLGGLGMGVPSGVQGSPGRGLGDFVHQKLKHIILSVLGSRNSQMLLFVLCVAV